MASSGALRAAIAANQDVRRWISRTFIVSILVYLVVIGYLVAESVMGASRWAPYGVSIPVFIALVIASEVIIVLTAVWVFRADSGIWPRAVSEGWEQARAGSVPAGLKKMLGGAWDVSIIDLRLRTRNAIFLGRVNRVAALVPLVYALAASAGGAPWGLRSSALVDIGITLAVWAFMELVMVRPAALAAAPAQAMGLRRTMPVVAPAVEPALSVRARKESRYEVRRVGLGDLDRIQEIERIKWKEQAASKEMVLSRLNVFPEGQLAAVHVSVVDGLPVRRSVAAWSTVMLANEAQVRGFSSWDQVTSSGTIQGCDLKGNVIVGVNLTSVTEGATYILMGEILAGVVEGGRKKLIGGSRLNGFVSFNERRQAEGKRPFTANEYARLREIRGHRINERRIDDGLDVLADDEYVALVRAGRNQNGRSLSANGDGPDYICSNLRGYMSLPGARMMGAIPDYFDDPSSGDYGVVIEWWNPLPVVVRHVPFAKRWAARQIRRGVRDEWESRKRRLREHAQRREAERVPEFLRRAREDDGVPVEVDSARVESGETLETRDRPGTGRR